MTMKYKVIFAARSFHPEREKFEIEKTEVLPNG